MNTLSAEKKDLPKGWIKTSVGQLYNMIGGGTPSTKIEKYWKGNIPWISSADIHGIYDIQSRRNITLEAIQNSATNMVPPESIIVVTRVGLGKIAYAQTSLCFSQDSQALVGNNTIVNPHYALYYLLTAVQIFKRNSRGTTISGVTKKQLSELIFLLPPIQEQKRIVSKLESILSQIDAGRRKLDCVRKLLKQNKQAVLRTAFEGRLVPQDPNDEPAEILLKRIHGNLKEPEYDTGSLPKGWIGTKLENIIDNPKQNIVDGPFGSNLKSSEYVNNGIPLIRLQNVERNSFIEKNTKYITKEKAIQLKRHNFTHNDIVITKLGLPVGKACIVPPYIESGIIVADIIRIRNNNEIILNEFLTYIMNSNVVIRQFNTYTKGTTRPRVNLTKFRNFYIPLPPLNEQKRIVSKIESIFGRIDANFFKTEMITLIHHII